MCQQVQKSRNSKQNMTILYHFFLASFISLLHIFRQNIVFFFVFFFYTQGAKTESMLLSTCVLLRRKPPKHVFAHHISPATYIHLHGMCASQHASQARPQKAMFFSQPRWNALDNYYPFSSPHPPPDPRSSTLVHNRSLQVRRDWRPKVPERNSPQQFKYWCDLCQTIYYLPPSSSSMSSTERQSYAELDAWNDHLRGRNPSRMSPTCTQASDFCPHTTVDWAYGWHSSYPFRYAHGWESRAVLLDFSRTFGQKAKCVSNKGKRKERKIFGEIS